MVIYILFYFILAKITCSILQIEMSKVTGDITNFSMNKHPPSQKTQHFKKKKKKTNKFLS